MAIDPLVVMANNSRDLLVALHFGQNSLADYGVLLHPPTLVKREGTWLLQQAGRKANLSDVVEQATKMHKLLLTL